MLPFHRLIQVISHEAMKWVLENLAGCHFQVRERRALETPLTRSDPPPSAADNPHTGPPESANSSDKNANSSFDTGMMQNRWRTNRYIGHSSKLQNVVDYDIPHGSTSFEHNSDLRQKLSSLVTGTGAHIQTTLLGIALIEIATCNKITSLSVFSVVSA